MNRLSGKTTLITGAASGLGRVAALTFAAQGSRIVISDVGDGANVIEEIKRAGGEAAYVKADVTSEASWAEVISVARSRFGSLDVL
ncbi:MAG: SDR family NAD(P)-dependent oxidoreductase, partial [Actinomycetota bacterium]